MKNPYLLFVSFALLFFISCGKYEDGPGISLRSKASRIDGSWKVEKYTEDGADLTSDYASLTFEFTKDGSYTVSDTYLGQLETGSWELTSNNEDLTFTFSDGTTEAYKILRLTNSDFWISQTYSGITDVIHLKAK